MDEDRVQSSFDNIKRLSDSELEELWNAYMKDRTNKQLHNKIVLQYLYLTKYVINRVKFTLPQSFEIDDITSFGIEGLIDAVKRFEPNKGARFETYAVMRIKGMIIDKIRALDWLPRSVRKKIKDIKNTIEQMRQNLGRNPTVAEVSAFLGIEEDKVNLLLAEDSPIGSIYDKKFIGDEGVEIVSTLEDPNEVNVLEALEEQDVQKKLNYALKKLPERERMVMVLYYHENMTLKEIGANINVSESRVCQIHARAIMKLRNILREYREERAII